MTVAAQFHRISSPCRREIECIIDAEPVSVLEGDTVLTAVLTHRRHLRSFEFSAEFRSGFCMMGACQDCWVAKSDGEPIRACSTLVTPGLRIVTRRGQADV